MDHFLPKLLPGLVVGVIKADSVISLSSDFRRRGKGHIFLEAELEQHWGWTVQEICMVCVP